jgi:S-adenosylmethionine:tRNA ribosyltransferase-isomerase
MTEPKNISILDYTYNLPVERIALHPLGERDASKLLIYQNGKIEQDIYRHIDRYLPADSLLVFNDTKVIKARIRFQKSSGGVIEIFCLEPYEELNEYSSIMSRKGSVKWKCMIGGAGKWKDGKLEKQFAVGESKLTMNARLVDKLPDAYVVEFSWTPAEFSFAEVLESAGDIPLPPYIKRKAEAEDTKRYQTIYAKDEGSVAAPTAGLHFTEDIFKRLAEKNIQKDFVTLHVGAGTFKPVKAATMQGHEMHAEWIDVSAEMIGRLLLNGDKPIVAVGTTSLRTLESLYWLGVKTILQPEIKQLQLSQWEVYEGPLVNCTIPVKEALSSLLDWLKKNNREKLFTQSQILITPGYPFKMANAIITNFHQPQSTLLLLVAAAVGEDLPVGQAGWRKIYDHALQNDFRFLSYGDGSLLFINK